MSYYPLGVTMHLLAISGFLFVLAVLYAIFEIEAEGKYGWGEKFPTWYRTRGFAAKLYKFFTNKPLTGYHSALFFVPILTFLWPMVYTATGSWESALDAFSLYFCWVVVWDFCWFVLNPYYGVKRFRKSYVWWFSQEPWIGGRVPFGYISAWAMSLVLAAGTGWLAGDTREAATDGVTDRLQMMGWFLAGLVILHLVVAPAFRRYYIRMRRHDDRALAGIFHVQRGARKR